MNGQNIRTSTFLRRVLLLDAATCVAAGLLMGFGAGVLEPALGLPAALLRYAGVALLPFAAFLVYLAARENLWAAALKEVILVNALWVAGSFMLLLSGQVAPTAFDFLIVIAQALGVAAFAGLEYFGLRRTATAATASA